MSVMETIRARPRMTSAVAVVVLLIALMRILFQLFGGPTNATGRNQAFYSDDDGKSWFIDDSRKGPPFDHHGRPAYLAVVCRTGGGKLFVASLQEYSEGTKAKIEAAHDSAEADHWRWPRWMRKSPAKRSGCRPAGRPEVLNVLPIKRRSSRSVPTARPLGPTSRQPTRTIAHNEFVSWR